MVWPIDYPFVVIQDIPVVAAPLALQVPLHRGDFGRVDNEDNLGNIQVSLPRQGNNPGPSGWIPRSRVQIGNQRSCTESYELRIQPPNVPDLSSGVYYDNVGLFAKTVSGLISSYHEHREDYPVQPPYLETELNTSAKIRMLEIQIVTGVGRVSAALSNLFRSGNFTAVEAMHASTRITGNTNIHQTGIYWILTDSGDGSQGDRWQLYTGSTEASFQTRYQGYQSEIRSASQRPVIRAIRGAQNWAMFPVCYMQAVGDGSPTIKLAEQVFLDLGQTYSSYSVRFGQPRHFQEEEDGPTPSAGEEITALAKNIIRKQQCFVMSHIASAVFQETGWPGCIRREQQGTSKVSNPKHFKATEGLNCQCPITEMSYAKMPWVKTRGRGFSNFRRTNVRCLDRGNHNNRKVAFEAQALPNYPYPPVNTMMHAVFEDPDSDSPLSNAPLSMLPAVGPFTDWRDASRIALRLEWKNTNGDWVGAYYQLGDRDMRATNAPSRGGLQNYNVSIGMRSYLLQERRRLSPAFNWLWDFGTARVKEVYLDHLRLRIEVRDVDNIRTVQGPTVRTDDDIGRELTSHPINLSRYSRPTDLQWPLFPSGRAKDRNAGDNRWNRSACDGCYVIPLQPNPDNPTQPFKKGRGSECKLMVGQQNMCERCYWLGRPCSFTPSARFDNLNDNSYEKRALIAPYKRHGRFDARRVAEGLVEI